jgi:regulatory protein
MPKNLNSDITKLITKYLSIREHSKLELQNKLSQKGHDLSDIRECINEFSLKGVQSDIRFAEEFIRSKLKKNKGPRLISSELVSRGIPDGTINKKISEISYHEWCKAAFLALNKKLNGSSVSIEDKDKIYSFLISRGFEHKMIKYAIDEQKDEC